MSFPAAFSVGVQPDAGPSLIFITLPNVFNQAFGGMPVVGWIVALMFYALLSLAAITSFISLHEVATSFLFEEAHISRQRGAAIVTAVTFVIAVFCSLSLGPCKWLSIGGKSLFDLFDFVTGQIFLPVGGFLTCLGGFLTCLFVGWYLPKQLLLDEFTNWGTVGRRWFGVYFLLVRWLCPIAILAIFLHQFGVF